MSSPTALVLFPYTATQEDELSVVQGEVLSLKHNDQVDPGWCFVIGQNGQGLVPEGYLQLNNTLVGASESKSAGNDVGGNEATSLSPPSSTNNTRAADNVYIAKFSYQATAPDELDLSPGDKLKLLQPPQQDGWTKAIRLSDNMSGLVPINFIEIIPEESGRVGCQVQ